MAFSGGNGPSTVTVLFTDVVGSTEARLHVGQEAADRLRRNHDRLLSQAVQAHRGRVVKGLGDGLMAIFPSASDALTAAANAQRALARYNRSETGNIPIEVRMGLSAGDVVFEESDCFGTPVVEASRLCDAARGGQILASELVQALAAGRGAHRFKPLGPLDLKGLSDPLPTVALVWESAHGLGLALPPGLEQPTAFPFVGREDEVERLRRLWSDVRTGDRRVAMVAGEPGIGKTRLIAELAVAAHDEGATVLYGRCQEEVGLPYQAFAEALRWYVATCPVERLVTQLGPLGGELVRLLPALPERVRDLPAPLRAEPETERYRLFEAVAGLLGGMSADAPVVVVLDDLHVAARPDLALLRHLLRPGESGRILFLGTYRDTEVTHDHALAPVLASLRRDAGVERLTLSGLDEGAVAHLLEVGAGPAVEALGPALVRAVHTETDGNPFFVGEVIRHLSESGAALRRAGSDAAEQIVAELGLPDGIREVIGRRLARLPATATEVLGAAAVIGREFDVGLLMEAAGDEADVVLDALERAEEARIVVPLPGRLDRYQFEHALVRSALRESLPASRRARLHRRVGGALEARRREEDLPDLAHHFHAAGPAGDPGRAIDYALRAAEQATNRLANEQAAAYYGLALDALAWVPDVGRQRRREALVGRAEAWRRAGESDNARTDFLAAAAAAREDDDPVTLARAALGVGEVAAVWGIDPGLVELLEEALARLGSGHRAVRARVLARLGQALYFSDPGQRLELSRRAIDEAREAGDPSALAAVLCARHVALFAADGLAERKEVAEEIIRLAEETGDPELALQGHAWRFVDLLELGDRPGAEDDLAAHAGLARSLRQPLHLRDAAMWRAMLATLEGRFSEAEQQIEETRTMGRQAHDTTAPLVYAVQRGWLLVDAERLGDLPAVLDLIRRIAGMVPEPVAPAWRASAALIGAIIGERAAAQAEFTSTVEAFARMPRDAAWLPCLVILAGTCAELEDRARVAALYDLLAPYAGRILVPDRGFACRGAIDRYLGELAALAGRLDAAAGHFAAAAALNERLGARPLLARSRCAYAGALVARGRAGDAAAAEALAADSLTAATALGMARLGTRARRVLERAAAGSRPLDPGPRSAR